MAELLEGKDARKCYDRYKELDLKHLSQEAAIQRSKELHSNI